MQLASVDINTAAMQHNLQRIKQLAPNARVLAMVKADGYGHGAAEMARAMSAADAVGVARIGEALELVAAGIRQDIVLMEGCFDASEYETAVTHGFQLVIHNDRQLTEFLALQTRAELVVWLKLDTGMHRLGFTPAQFKQAYSRLRDCRHCAQPIRLMTHFACADDVQHPFNDEQLSLFNATIQEMTGALSIANSATILTRADRHLDWVRPGIILYGASPVLNTTADDFGLRPVMTFKTQVIAVKDIAKGERVGYGGDWQAATDTRIAVVAAGYGDGYPRHARSGTPVLINGIECPLVGRVSMDMLTVEIPKNADIEIGASVVLWGEGLLAERIAQCANTISYTLFCGITSRVHRSYLP